MHLYGRSLIVLALASALLSGTVLAENPAAQDTSKPAGVTTPIKVTVTISRLQGEKRVSSLPYVLSVNVASNGGSASLRMGTKVPVVTAVLAKEPTTTFTYTDVGTNIDCRVFPVEGGGFRIDITIEESSVIDDLAGKGVVQVRGPSIRSFRTIDSVLLRDGQSKEVTSVPDKLTGEVVKVDVAIAVVK